MTGPIKANTGIAKEAISKFGSGNVRSKTTSLGESNLSGMKTAMQVSNKMVGDLMKLKKSTKKQADKFPKLAPAIERRDRNDANSLLNNAWGWES